MNRHHRREDGTPKARLTRSAAKKRCIGEPFIKPYFCHTCRGWHVGHVNRVRHEPTEWERTWDRIRGELDVA